MRRRSWMAGGASLVVGVVGFGDLLARRRGGKQDSLLGPLRSDPNGILDLPEGFTYRVLQRRGEEMSDGFLVPGQPDAMACFADGQGHWVLMRNHELGSGEEEGRYLRGSRPSEAYRSGAYGGVSRLVMDPVTLRVVSSNLVLTGTSRNCAGGPSPWGWLTCEESVDTDHGYVFLCSPDAERLQRPERVATFGRCRREAAAVDVQRHITYLTEDEPDSCLYRFVPNTRESPFEGELQALSVVGSPGKDLGTGLRVGQELAVEWVPIRTDVDARELPLRQRARRKGAAILRRGEGIWASAREVYFSSTSGGPVGGGQIFSIPLDTADRLRLVAQSHSRWELDMPDNITLSARGGLYISEDGIAEQYLRGMLPGGQLFTLARNALSYSELTGVCFSPGDQALFVNIQDEGLTLAIEGPFPA